VALLAEDGAAFARLPWDLTQMAYVRWLDR
jgi:hypothetical protein